MPGLRRPTQALNSNHELGLVHGGRPKSSEAWGNLVLCRHSSSGAFSFRTPRPRLDDCRVFGVVPGSKCGAGTSSVALCKEIPGATSGCRVKVLFDTNTPAPLAGSLR